MFLVAHRIFVVTFTEKKHGGYSSLFAFFFIVYLFD